MVSDHAMKPLPESRLPAASGIDEMTHAPWAAQRMANSRHHPAMNNPAIAALVRFDSVPAMIARNP